MSGQVTINDVARVAGVSKGTVDRVLHNRPEVSRKTYEKVMKVIEDLGFTPNINASLLSLSKPRLILCIIPEFSSGEVWELWANGIEASRENASRYGVAIKTLNFDQYDTASFDRVAQEALSLNPSGVIVAPMFSIGALRLAKSLAERGIPYSYIDSKPDDDAYLAFYGMPMYQSGYLAGRLLTLRREKDINEIVNVRILRDRRNLSDPTMMRRKGFGDYILEHLPQCNVSEVYIDPRDSGDIRRKLDEAILPRLRKGPVYVVMFNSRVHLVASYLEESALDGVSVVGFDSLEKNLVSLRHGSVETVIAQHCDTQMLRAISDMTDMLVFSRKPSHRDHYTQMDILNSLNCEYYL